MAMNLIEKTPGNVSFTGEINITLANAIRRSVNEIPILAIEEADIYKNDSALYDEIIAHRLGLVVLKNQKLKSDQTIEMKMKVKGKNDRTEVLAGELGSEVVYPETPIVLLEDKQEIELVARARVGRGIEHSKFSPGVLFYKHLPNIKISSEGAKQVELAEIYPEVFERFGDKIKIKNAWVGDLDEEDVKNYQGINVEFNDDLVFSVESWGQIEAKDIFLEACKALKANLSEVSKVVN